MTRWSCENALLTTTFIEKGKMFIDISYQYNQTFSERFHIYT